MKSDTERKLYYNAPLHIRRNQMHAHLSKELRTKLGKRSLLVKTGDTVMVTRGTHKTKQGKVARLNYTKRAVYIEGITLRNAKGDEVSKAIPPSNLMIIKISESKALKSKEVSIKKGKKDKKDKKENFPKEKSKEKTDKKEEAKEEHVEQKEHVKAKEHVKEKEYTKETTKKESEKKTEEKPKEDKKN